MIDVNALAADNVSVTEDERIRELVDNYVPGDSREMGEMTTNLCINRRGG